MTGTDSTSSSPDVPPVFQLLAGTAMVGIVPATDDLDRAAVAAWDVARQAAAAGRRVALVDCYVDAPRLHAAAGEPNGDGIVDVFEYGTSLSRIARHQREPNLFFVPAGTFVTDPVAMLANQRWGRLAAGFRHEDATMLLYLPPEGIAPIAALLDGLIALTPDGAVVGLAATPEIQAAMDGGLRLLAIVTEVGGIEPVEPADADFAIRSRSGARRPAAESERLEAAPAEPEPPARAKPEPPAAAKPEPPAAATPEPPPPEASGEGPEPDGEVGMEEAGEASLEEEGRGAEEPGTTETADAGAALGGRRRFRMWPAGSADEETPDDLPAQGRPRARTRWVSGRWVVLGILVIVAAGAVAAGIVRLRQRPAPTGPRVEPPPATADSPAAGASPAATRPPAASPAPPPAAERPAPPAADSLPYAVQVSAWTQLSQAFAAADRLEAKGFHAMIAPVQVRQRLWYRVYAGPAATRAAAESLHAAVRAARLSGEGAVVALVPLSFKLRSYASRSGALAARRRLRDAGVPGFVLGEPEGTFRLFAGAYATAPQATDLRRLLSTTGNAGPLGPRVGLRP
jgi:cell division septation protein DedD